MNRAALIIIADLCILLALSIGQIIVSNHFSTTGITLAKIQAETDSLEKENLQLSEKLYTATSYTTIAEKAKAMGFVENTNDLVLTRPLPIAQK